MKKLILLIITIITLSCTTGDKYNNYILTDTRTGELYLLQHNIGDNYFIEKLDNYSLKNYTININSVVDTINFNSLKYIVVKFDDNYVDTINIQK